MARVQSLAKQILFLALCLGSLRSFGDSVKFLDSDKEALQARVDLIQQAKSEILVEYFSVWNDDQSVGAFALLLDAAHRGVKVKVIMDALSNSVPRALISAMEIHGMGPDGQKNFELKVYNPVTSLNITKLTHRTHSKMLIVDQKLMVNGGRNVGDKYFGFNKKRNYKDADVMVSGDVVKAARENFLTVWQSSVARFPELYENDAKNILQNNCWAMGDLMEHCERTRAHAVEQYNAEIKRIYEMVDRLKGMADDQEGLVTATNRNWLLELKTAQNIEFLSHEPEGLVSEKTNRMTRQVKERMLNAQEEVFIVSPYLIPTEGLHQVFEALTKKGIKLTIVTNSLRSTDNLFAQAGYRIEKSRLAAAGVQIYEYNGPNTLHAKMSLIDRKQTLIGTFNLDPRSMNLNREVGLAITGESTLNQEVYQYIQSAIANSILVAQDGEIKNEERDFEGISASKKILLHAIMAIVPMIKGQI